ncbi:uL30 family ribosomal protein [Candidatus Woesearchaeota archaeon]|nr:uL30 family ribosomal protein [Candidatus Woesearchaeota archaeon]
MIAIVRIRGTCAIDGEIRSTLDMLNVHKKNYCSVVPKNPSYGGMIKKVKDYITWGEIDDATLKLLKEKRGKDGKSFFRLNPPTKGYGRKGIKIPFSRGGGLGERGQKINDLIQRMV